ncbi:threonine aldolase family protein [Thalassotalea montiporae]
MYKGILLGHPLMSECNKFLTRHKPLSHRQWIERIEQSSVLDQQVDFFGTGPTVELLEQKIASILGKERALFVHKGMVGQHSALLHWSSLSNLKTIAIHPQSHMEVDEELAYKELLGLEAVTFGKPDQAIDDTDIKKLPKDLSAICIELPTRRAGFKLPTWQSLINLKQFSIANNIPLHIDGARLFEAACHYKKPYEEVAALGDSVYISLYKTLGAAAGGIIAGNSDFIEQVKPWRSRLGGDLFTAFPYVLTALWGIEHYLPRIPEFHERALKLSNLIQQVFGSQAIPYPVQCNGFLVELPIEADELERRALALAKTDKIWLFDRIVDTGDKSCRFEIQVGDALDDWQDQELIEVLTNILR